MKIKSLNLTHYRGAIALPLVFDERLNVFFGVNGAGKSTVLDALALMLSWAVSRIRHPGSSGRPIAEEDIANGKSSAVIDIACSTEIGPFEWKLSKSRPGHLAEEKSTFNGLSEYARSIQARIVETEAQYNIPLLVHYPVNRAVLDIPLRI